MAVRKTKKPAKKQAEALEAFSEIGDLRNLPKDMVEKALAEAMEKAYRRHSGLEDVKVKTVFENGQIRIYHEREIVETPEEVEDEEFQISLDDARKIRPDAQVGEYIDEEARFEDFERSDIALVKNVMKQKIREAEKEEILANFTDRVEDLITGVVDTVEDKFVLVRLGGTPEGKPQPGSTLAIMRNADKIPTEVYTEGQPLQVVITKVDRESKGALVMVSRSDPNFVKRLFEKEVPEIYQGLIEIKAIARDPGLRAKMAVYSHNENIDPIGACIGPRGSRVQAIINELNGEKIDIFEWSDDLQKLVSNALSPAQGVQIFYADDAGDKLEKEKSRRAPREGRGQKEERRALVAAVPDNQLSLAIGKKGQNAKLAYRLCGHRIDIRSQSELDNMGIPWRTYVDKMAQEYEEKKAAERAYKQQQRIEELRSAAPSALDLDELNNDFTFQDDFDDNHLSQLDTLANMEQEDKDLPESIDDFEKLRDSLLAQQEAQAAEEPALSEMEEAARIAKENRKSLSERRAQQYVSKLETPAAEPVKAPAAAKPAKPAASSEAPKPKKKPSFQQIHPIYTEDELAEIEENEIEEEMSASWNEDVDYEEYDSYYDDEY